MDRLQPKLWDDYVYDWEMGKHSNIPACCRVFYIVRNPFWERGWISLRLNQWYNGLTPGCFYVACPVCTVTRRKRQLHYCYPGCGEPKIWWEAAW